MVPTEIKKVGNEKLQITWVDGFSSEISLKELRYNCPCARCQGEQVGFVKYQPAKLELFSPAKYEIQSIEPVGNYAIQVVWKDGHDTGIYSFEYLRSLMEKFSKSDSHH
ncbi:MAG: gamma-butyrobetaine hydroxylase-like domain-containing protein [Candidatus Kapaibacteriota bacterium]